MSFLGKKFKRVSSEDMDKLADVPWLSGKLPPSLNGDATFVFNKVGDDEYELTLTSSGRVIKHTFKPGQEGETKRRDGSSAFVTYYFEGENSLCQTVRGGDDGRSVHFRRDFTDNKCVMTIKPEGVDFDVKTFYEEVVE